MAFDLDKLASIAKPRSAESIAREQFQRENAEWLSRSMDIALAVRYYLRTENITQKQLAEKLGVSAPYVAKIMKGCENLTIDTICKIETAIGHKIMSVFNPYDFSIVPAENISTTDFEVKQSTPFVVIGNKWGNLYEDSSKCA